MSINNSTQLDELFGKVYPITIQITILRSITSYFYFRNSLMYAVRCDSSEMVNLILQQGVDINFEDLFGWTALHYAIEGDREV